MNFNSPYKWRYFPRHYFVGSLPSSASIQSEDRQLSKMMRDSVSETKEALAQLPLADRRVEIISQHAFSLDSEVYALI